MQMREPNMETMLRGRHFKHVLDQVLASLRASFDLRPVETEVLYFIYENGETTSAEICRRLEITKGHVSQAADTLVTRGYLTAVQDEQDRRRTIFSLTEAASPVISALEKERREILGALMEGVSGEELMQLCAIWEKLAANADRLLEQRTGNGVRGGAEA